MMGTMLTGCVDTTEGEDAAASGVETEKGMDESAEGEDAGKDESASSGDAVTLDLYVNFTWFPTDSWSGIIP